jgi:hypothetical protein
MPVEYGTVDRAVFGSVPVKNRSIRRGKLGFHVLEFTGIDEVVISAW